MNYGRRFHLLRHTDQTGISGEGVVAWGVVFPDGVVAMRWNSAWPSSVVFYDRGVDAVEAVHGHGGATEIVWLDLEEEHEDSTHRHDFADGDSVLHGSSHHQALLDDEHHYISTACRHDLHARCRQRCKFCGAQCLCKHHREEPDAVSS